MKINLAQRIVLICGAIFTLLMNSAVDSYAKPSPTLYYTLNILIATILLFFASRKREGK